MHNTNEVMPWGNRGGCYQPLIREIAATQGHIGIDPRHVEGWMRVARGPLDGLSRPEFELEVAISIQCIKSSTLTTSEQLALSYGL